MPKVSVIIPSRDEKFLIPTIRDVFRSRRGECEVVAVLDSDKWPDGWPELQNEFRDLHTIHNGKSIGMRPSINRGVASAISRNAKYIFKLDAHCALDEGFDVKLAADCEPNWVVIPRRKRLDAENWQVQKTDKPDIDYHYLSYPDDPTDFGGAGLNGKVWEQRARERLNKPEYDIDEEMSSQGSAWFMHAQYFTELELMDDANYGTFWNEMQEIGCKCWLSGGQMTVNKKTWYAHLHKGRKYGRGYHLDERQLTKGRNYTMKWLYNEAWTTKQTLPFKTLIERFWPVPGWPEDWERLVYEQRPSRQVDVASSVPFMRDTDSYKDRGNAPSLVIDRAFYGVKKNEHQFDFRGGDPIDVTECLRSLVVDNALDLVVSNSTLGVSNPFRGKKKTLRVTYAYDGGEPVTVERNEKDALIIGQASKPQVAITVNNRTAEQFKQVEKSIDSLVASMGQPSRSATALNDFLIRKFSITEHRLRAPMPVELRDFTRNDLAKLFSELGFTKGAEIGVAEGHYSEILCQSIPNLQLICVDPWTRYSDNPRAHSEEHQQFSLNETKRRLAPYGDNVKIVQDYSMNAVRDVPEGSLDFVYVDSNHQFSYCMEDLIAWGRRVRSGGVISGDDYYQMKHQGGVVEAVQAYTRAHGIAMWFICAAPRSVDYFWVKP